MIRQALKDGRTSTRCKRCCTDKRDSEESDCSSEYAQMAVIARREDQRDKKRAGC